MKRKNDWLVQLNKVLDKYNHRVEPNEINCAVFVGEAVEAMTDTDLMKPFADKSLEEQLESLESLGYGDPIEYVATHFTETKKSFAQVGDIAVFTVKGKPPAFGVVIGEYVRVIRPDGQPGLLPVARAKKVFKL